MGAALGQSDRPDLGNAPASSPRLLPGRPNGPALAGVGHVQAGTVQARHPPASVPRPRVSWVARGRAACSNSARNGSGPSRARAWISADLAGRCQLRHGSRGCRHPAWSRNPSTRQRNTSTEPIPSTVWGSAIGGTRTRTPGEPDPEDVTLRDRARELAATVPPGPARMFYRRQLKLQTRRSRTTYAETTNNCPSRPARQVTAHTGQSSTPVHRQLSRQNRQHLGLAATRQPRPSRTPASPHVAAASALPPRARNAPGLDNPLAATTRRSPPGQSSCPPTRLGRRPPSTVPALARDRGHGG
jgi:hypothetical protein